MAVEVIHAYNLDDLLNGSRMLRRSTSLVLGFAATLVTPLLAQTSSPAPSFRGLGIASDGTIWASGTRGTVLRSTDGGKTWETRSIPDATSFDLRDIEAVNATTAYAMVAGTDTGRTYKTTDGGTSWI